MNMLLTIVCSSICLMSAVTSAVLQVEKCRLEDSECMTKAFQAAMPVFMGGIPQLGVEVMDVMDMEDVKFDLAGLQFSLKEGKLKGLKTSIVDKVEWQTKKKRLDVVFHLNASIKGHYTAGGRILILPITGDGELKLKLKNIQIKLTINYEMETVDGKLHVAPKSYNLSFDVKENAHFNLTNLFNGNKELGDAMHTFLNGNWREISQMFGQPLMEVAAKKIFKNVVKFMQEQPIEDIAIVE